MDEEDDDEFYKAEYEGGHWEWDENNECLAFISDTVENEDYVGTSLMTRAFDFKHDLDIIEQQRYRKRYQRKIVENDVVMLQDIKDLVLYTAQKHLVTAKIVSILHLPAMERFLRALILYCQYFTQISEEMAQRTLALQTKVRNSLSEDVETHFRENLEDLRILVAKEYCLMIKGDANFVKFHHMGAKKDSVSLLKKEAVFFESFLRICIQIVWLALGRYAYTQLEFEIHRLFKSELYNLIEHNASSVNWYHDITEVESRVLFGDCVGVKGKLNTHSPLLNEIHCTREVDYRLYGLGIIKYHDLGPRLKYLEQTLIAPEKSFKEQRISLGILGFVRSRFDTMLKEIKVVPTTTSTTSIRSQSRRLSKTSMSYKSGASILSKKLLVDIIIPMKRPLSTLPDNFLEEMYPRLPAVDNIQRKKWFAYVTRLQFKAEGRRSTSTIPQPS